MARVVLLRSSISCRSRGRPFLRPFLDAGATGVAEGIGRMEDILKRYGTRYKHGKIYKSFNFYTVNRRDLVSISSCFPLGRKRKVALSTLTALIASRALITSR